MKNFFDKIFFRSNNLDTFSRDIKKLTINTPVIKIFETINNYSSDSEIRYVGGCIRKIINKENVDDIDLATNIEPKQVCEALRKSNIDFYETGIEHGTVTAVINKYKFEITSLREDISTDGRHAMVKFSKSWKDDASRRDFTINSIYSDCEGNLFDPYNGMNDLKNGNIKFIGNADIRIQEDYLRILRYIRFYLGYSKTKHNSETISILKKNIDGISKLSKERLLIELKKIITFDLLKKLSKDKISLELLTIIFSELKDFSIFFNPKSHVQTVLKEADFIFLLSLMIIDGTDNVDYFLYKFNISKNDKKRIKIIDDFYKNKINSKIFLAENMNKIFYYNGKQAVIDILNFRIIKSKKLELNLIELCKTFKNKLIPEMPIKANILMAKYKIPEGKMLGKKLKIIEREWVNNNFKISDKEVENIVKD